MKKNVLRLPSTIRRELLLAPRGFAIPTGSAAISTQEARFELDAWLVQPRARHSL